MSCIDYGMLEARIIPLDWLLLILASLVPGLLWVWFFFRQDSSDKEPISLLATTFGLGVLAILPAAWLEMPFRDMLIAPAGSLSRLVTLIAAVGLIEEASKLAALYPAYRSPAWNEPVDGIIYGSTAGLGFAAAENLLYAATFGFEVLPLRAVFASLAHASFSGLVGFYLARVKLRGQSGWIAIYGLLVAAVLHGFYNFVLIDEAIPAAFAIPLVFLIYRHLSSKIREARLDSPS